MVIKSAKDLIVYQKAFDLSMRLFRLSTRFPPEERYALTGQIRRSSRSVCLNLREAWAKRRYRAALIAKLTDCDGEANETDSSIDYAFHCSYVGETEFRELSGLCCEVGRMLGAMLNNPNPFLIDPDPDD